MIGSCGTAVSLSTPASSPRGGDARGFFWVVALMARTIDPNQRALVFIDGQNAYKACRSLYRSGPCHPLCWLSGSAQGRKLVGVRFYSGVHDPTVDPHGRSFTDLRHNLMRRTGVTVVERKLRYRTEWGFDLKSLPDPHKVVNIGV